MDTRKIRKLIELVKETGIGELEVKSGEESVRINCQTISNIAAPMTQHYTTPPAEPAPSKLSNLDVETKVQKPKALEGHHVKSPMVGTAFLAPTPGTAPFISVGQHVEIGDTLCLIEAMKMFNKIEADRAGTISARLVENDQPVEYDQSLFIIDTGE